MRYKPSGYIRTTSRRNPAARGNCDRGVSAERAVTAKYVRHGWNIDREGKAHKGYDFIATKGGSRRYIEVKSGHDSALRESQKKAKRRHGSKYRVHKVHKSGSKWDLSGIRL